MSGPGRDTMKARIFEPRRLLRLALAAVVLAGLALTQHAAALEVVDTDFGAFLEYCN